MKKLILILIAGFFVSYAHAQTRSAVLLSNTYQHAFSDPSKKDLFKLTLTGKTILKGKVLFEIMTPDHRVIHSETFPATDLYGDMDDDYFKTKQRSDTIRARFKAFFALKHYKLPAIPKDWKFYDDNSTRVIWDELKSDRKSIGFLYSHGYEGTYGIAWSKKQKKVVDYFYSD